MFTDTITLFNLNNGMWYPHIIHNVDAAGIISGASATPLNGSTKADNGLILIQTYGSAGIKAIDTDSGTRVYVEPKAYAALVSGSSAVTFQPQTDFIMLGAYEGVSPIVDDDYEAGFYDEMNSKYDNIYQIVSAAYYSLIPHFEIGVR